METKVSGFYAPGAYRDLRYPLIIAFGHKKQNGKDAACSMIYSETFGSYRTEKFSFAAALKREVVGMGNQRTLCELLNLPYDENPPMDDPLLPAPYGKQRALLQYWGTEFRRRLDPDYWVKKTLADIKAANPTVALISDLRFKNEFAAVKAAGGVAVNVTRTAWTDPAPSSHVSETELDDAPYDYRIQAHDLGGLNECVVETFHEIMRIRGELILTQISR